MTWEAVILAVWSLVALVMAVALIRAWGRALEVDRLRVRLELVEGEVRRMRKAMGGDKP